MHGMQHSPYLRHLFGLALLTLLGGCVSKDMSDLEQYVDTVLARKGGSIEPLPPIKPYERYLYQAAELGQRDPFKSFIEEERRVEQVDKITDAQQQAYAAEILTHNREELEGHELDTLRMVGAENVEALWASCAIHGVVHARRQLRRAEFWQDHQYPGRPDRRPGDRQGRAGSLRGARRNPGLVRGITHKGVGR